MKDIISITLAFERWQWFMIGLPLGIIYTFVLAAGTHAAMDWFKGEKL